MNEIKVQLRCIYIYEQEGQDLTARYKSPRHSHNLNNPNVIANILSNEIKKETGRTVKDFIMVAKDKAE